MSPTQAALMTAPLALFSGALSPVIGKRLGTSNPNGTPFRGLPCWWLDLLFCVL